MLRLFKRNAPQSIKPAKHLSWRDMYENGGTLKLAAAVSSEVARLVTLEFDSKLYGSERADYIAEAYSRLIGNARSFCEIACALGGVVFKPYVAGGKIATAIVPADSFEVTAVAADGTICGAKFFERTIKNGIRYIKCEEHLLSDGVCKITNTAYTDSMGVLDEAELSEVQEWADLDREVIIEGVTIPLFAYFKMPFVSTDDIMSPLGSPVFSRAARLIEDAERQYERMLWEFESGERALYVDETAVKRGIRGETQLPDKRLYRMLNTGNDELFEDWTPELRDEALINGFNRILQRIEFNCGLAYGTLSDPQEVEKTAEEIRSSKQRSYATVTEIQTALENALRSWAAVADVLCDIYALAPSGDYFIDFAFDDSIIADRQTEFSERLELLKEGVITADEMRSWYMGESEGGAI